EPLDPHERAAGVEVPQPEGGFPGVLAFEVPEVVRGWKPRRHPPSVGTEDASLVEPGGYFPRLDPGRYFLQLRLPHSLEPRRLELDERVVGQTPDPHY